MSWVCVGKIQDIPPSSGRLFRGQGGEEMGIFHLSDGRFLATENRCPHRGGPLSEGMISGHFVFCPLHDRKIDLETGQVQFPEQGCVKTFPLKIVQDAILVDC